MQAYDLSGLTVLIVEKQAPMRALLRQVLREFGINEIHDAADPAEAFERFNEVTPDLVLCDWAPDFDGLGLVRAVRTDEASVFPQAPVIMITAFNETGYIYEALDAGMNEYLSKPVSARLLYQRIVAVIENKRLFVRAGGFIGPDRRRRAGPAVDHDRRADENRNQAARSRDEIRSYAPGALPEASPA